MPSSINLGYWTGGGRERVYLNGHDLGAGVKVWFERQADGGSRVLCSDRSFFGKAKALGAEVLQARGLTESASFAEIQAIADPPRRRGATSTPDGSTARRAPAPGRDPSGVVTPPHRLARYDSAATAALVPIRMTHPIPEPTRLLVDHREPEEILQYLATCENLQVEVAQLETGDYVVPHLDDPLADPRLIIERKTVVDLQTSLTEDGQRVMSQARRMAAQSSTRVLLVEGDLWSATRISLESLSGLLTFMATIAGTSPILSIDARHTAHLVAKLVRHTVHGLGYEIPLRPAGPRDPDEAARYVLEGLPGVSTALARALLARFGSVRGVALAAEAELRDVKGIGPKKAQDILRVLAGA